MDPSATRATVCRPVGRSVAPPALGPNATLASRIDLTPTVARLWIRPDDGVPAFEPGQYFALGLAVDGRLLQRPYSTASARGTRCELEFLIRLVPDGAFTPRLWRLAPGDRLRIGRPKGLFRLRPRDPRRHLFVATGTGLAPLLSMLESLIVDEAAPGPKRPFGARALVVHGVAHVRELAYRDRLETLASANSGADYVPVVSRRTESADRGWSGLTGRLDAQLQGLLDRHAFDPAGCVAYLCGNPAMIATSERTLSSYGFSSDAIVSEQYWPMT